MQLLGPLCVFVRSAQGDGPPLALTGLPARLLALLALHPGQSFARGDLVATLWGDRLDGSAPAALSTALWRLRRVVEAAPLAGGDVVACSAQGTVALAVCGGVQVDVGTADALAAAADGAGQRTLSTAEVDGLQRGVALYRGELLCGFCDDWVLRERERLRGLHIERLQRLMHHHADAGAADAAAHVGDAILAIDPLREDVHRALMRLFARQGQRGRALRQFERCREALRRELDVPPMPETVRLYRELAGPLSAGSPTIGPTPTPAPLPPPDADTPAQQLRAARAVLAQLDARLAAALRQVESITQTAR